tara:strand:+ start:18 stop:536 length:519 start_codon:yes stop_codon:yes gene_type:complete
MKETIPQIIEKYEINQGAKVLDVGCGNGQALRLFRELGCIATGVGFGEEAANARMEGFDIIEEDMSFLNIGNDIFDVVWCRHVIEHSIFPFFTINEMYRILKKAGIFYMEVPAPETNCQHENNVNHYSVLGYKNWVQLLNRTGFEIIKAYTIEFTVPAGPDKYFAYQCRKTP